eukprot:symbB.v1.2.024631.t1/scaffold2332.1/size82080/4
MSARSRGSSVGNLVKRFESAAHGEAKTRSEPKGHPLAFAFARWWRAVQPLEKLCQTSDTNKLEQQKCADRMDKVQSKAKEFLEAEQTSKEGTFLSSTQTPSQGQSSGSTDLSGSEVEALVAAARIFLSKHRVKEPSLNVSMDRGIRLDLDSDSESEEKGARDVLAAAKLFARIQHLSGSLPDAFAASLGELWTSPPHEIQQSSWRESHDSMVLSETDKDWQRMSAEAQLESAQEVIKEQRDLLELEQLQKEEMQKKLQDLEEMLEKRSQEAEMLCLERLQSKELEIKLKMQEEHEMLQCKVQHFEEMELKLKNAEEQQERLQLEKQQWEELEKKLKKTQEQYEMLHLELERSLQEQRDMLQLERLQCEELEKKLKKTQEVVHKEENKVEQLENKVELLCQENAELQTCQVQLNEVLSERQVLLDALAVNEALNQDDMKEVLQIASGSDLTGGTTTTSALRNAAGVLTELRQRLASSKAQQQQLVEKCERLQARHDEDARELERYRQLCGPVEAWSPTGACGNEPG